MHNLVALVPKLVAASTLHYFCLNLHNFALQMTPIHTKFSSQAQARRLFQKRCQNFGQISLLFKTHLAAKGLTNLYTFCETRQCF